MNYYTNVSCVGNNILYRGVEDGVRVSKKIQYSPTLYIECSEPTQFKSLDGKYLLPKVFDSINDARDFIKQYEGVSGFTIYGNNRYEYAYIAEYFPDQALNWNQDNIIVAYIDIEVGSENGFPTVDDAAEPITAITIKLSNDSTYYVFGCGGFSTVDPNVKYVRCKNEDNLLHSFLRLWKQDYPDAITGWNVKTFDIPYLYNRISRLMGEDVANTLSPWNRVYAKPEQFYGKDIAAYHIVGISTLDYLQLFRKYAPNYAQESYKLDHIAYVELKEKKISYDEYDSLHQLYKKDYQKFIEYNIHDVRLVERLNAKGGLVDMALTLAYDNKTNFDDVFQQVRMWDCICYNHLLRKNIIIPPNVHKSKDFAYEGAYVKDPQIGEFRWVVSFDLNSLYPHLMMQYNLSPETIINEEDYTYDMRLVAKKYSRNIDAFVNKEVDLDFLSDFTFTPNGQYFRKDVQGFLPEIMQMMYDDRVIYKKKMIECKKLREKETDKEKNKELDALISRYNNLQLAKKVSLNSAYGACGNEFFRFFDIRIAEAVTLSGKLSIKWIESKLNSYMSKLLKTENVDYVIASDTDSIYLNLGPLVDKVYGNSPNLNPLQVVDFMDKVSNEKIQPFIDKQYQELAKYVNAYAQKMQMKRESLVDRAIWTAKKRYILNVWDQEGVRYSEPQLKIQGLEAIKSSTPSACRDKIKEAIKIILGGDKNKLYDYIDNFRNEFKKLPIEDISFPRSVNELDKFKNVKAMTLSGYETDESKGKLGTPMHVKAAILYNYYIKEMGIDSLYPVIQEGEKIKYIYLKNPNKFRSHVIAFPHRAPKEFKLDQCVDYNTQFDKSFMEPLKIILNSIDWKTERESTLEDFFS